MLPDRSGCRESRRIGQRWRLPGIGTQADSRAGIAHRWPESPRSRRIGHDHALARGGPLVRRQRGAGQRRFGPLVAETAKAERVIGAARPERCAGRADGMPWSFSQRVCRTKLPGSLGRTTRRAGWRQRISPPARKHQAMKRSESALSRNPYRM